MKIKIIILLSFILTHANIIKAFKITDNKTKPKNISNNNSNKIYTLGDNIGFVELISVSGNDLDVVNAARVSHANESQEFTENDAKLIRYLINNNHGTPFEQNMIKVRVKAPLFVSTQWLRHRVGWSYNFISDRYVICSEEFYTPKFWRYQDHKNRQGSVGEFENEQLIKIYQDSLDYSLKAYKELIKNGVSREMARGVLPHCKYTGFIATCNLRSLMHFLSLRLDKHAQWETRQYAQAMFDLVKDHFPVSLAAYQEKNKVFWDKSS